MQDIKPIGSRVLVERAEAKSKTEGGIYIPEAAQEKTQEVIVLALGTECKDSDGNTQEFPVAVNDKVLITKYGGTEVEIGGRKLLLVHTDDILAVLG